VFALNRRGSPGFLLGGVSKREGEGEEISTLIPLTKTLVGKKKRSGGLGELKNRVTLHLFIYPLQRKLYNEFRGSKKNKTLPGRDKKVGRILNMGNSEEGRTEGSAVDFSWRVGSQVRVLDARPYVEKKEK